MTTPAQPFGIIERYRDRMPMEGIDRVVTLGEGSTPLVPAPVLGARLDAEVFVKVEGANPTGSFKDRGMTMAMSKALADGSKAVVCASTGNTSASAAAYATRAGLTPVVLLPQGKIAAGKLAQAVVHGGRIIQVLGNFDDCLTIARELADHFPVSLVNSVNPYRIEGQKSASFEIVDALGDAPDIHALPVGNAGNITAYWKGYQEYAADGPATHTPRMFGFQAAGAAPLVLGHDVENPETVATAIRIGRPASGDKALAARDSSGGLIEAVTDEQILDAQAFLAGREGIFVEPASAAGVAGLLALKDAGRLDAGQRIVITVTGNGLKDIDTALSRTTLSTEAVEASTDRVAAVLGLHE
ncbi:threonine synthase [Acidipropionibacterium timonense]|uniref:threonine synthase n=1 Tax=Acidipropionibacterium timonense TaxID=2161818 RepID=UPI00102FA3FB|nr:threonine synthase [Acidipropionibacterium timonense]